jgi:hypothetical protein
VSTFEANRWPRWRRVVLTALAACLFSPSAARAACGDPGPDEHDHAAHLPGPHPAPCQGPNCSQAPQQAPLAPISAPVPVADPVALLCRTVTTAPPRSARLFAAIDLGRPIPRPSPPEPPPRS